MPVETAQRDAQAVECQSLAVRIRKLSCEAQQAFVMAQRAGVVSGFPVEDAERIAQGRFAALVRETGSERQRCLQWRDDVFAGGAATTLHTDDAFERGKLAGRVAERNTQPANFFPGLAGVGRRGGTFLRDRHRAQHFRSGGLVAQLSEQARGLLQRGHSFGVSSKP